MDNFGTFWLRGLSGPFGGRFGPDLGEGQRRNEAVPKGVASMAGQAVGCPLRDPKVPSTRDHKALNRGTKRRGLFQLQSMAKMMDPMVAVVSILAYWAILLGTFGGRIDLD